MDKLSLHSASTVCSIYPHSFDELRLINFPQNLLPAFRIAIQSSWGRGIQSEGSKDSKSCYVVKLHGYPWRNSKTAAAVETIRLTISIMQFMHSHGWGLEPSTHIQRRNGQDSWFFRKRTQQTQHVVMCGISFGWYDSIRVVDGSPEITQAVQSTIENHWSRGLQRHIVLSEADEFKLKGNPWTYTDRTRVSEFIMYLIDSLSSVGWTLYASVGTGISDEIQMDDWILVNSKL